MCGLEHLGLARGKGRVLFSVCISLSLSFVFSFSSCISLSLLLCRVISHEFGRSYTGRPISSFLDRNGSSQKWLSRSSWAVRRLIILSIISQKCMRAPSASFSAEILTYSGETGFTVYLCPCLCLCLYICMRVVILLIYICNSFFLSNQSS